MKDYANNKESKIKFKERLNLLFLNHDDKFKDLPLIVILTILNNYYISIKSKEKFVSNNEEGIITLLLLVSYKV